MERQPPSTPRGLLSCWHPNATFRATLGLMEATPPQPVPMVDPAYYGRQDAAPFPGAFAHYSVDAVPATEIFPHTPQVGSLYQSQSGDTLYHIVAFSERQPHFAIVHVYVPMNDGSWHCSNRRASFRRTGITDLVFTGKWQVLIPVEV